MAHTCFKIICFVPPFAKKSSGIIQSKKDTANEVRIFLIGTHCLYKQCCRSGDPGSGAFFIPGSRISDPGSQTHIFESLVSDNFLGKKFYNSLKIGPNFFLQHFKNKIIFNFVKFMAAKKGMTTNSSTPLFSFCFWIHDPEIRDGRIRDKHPGSATLFINWPELAGGGSEPQPVVVPMSESAPGGRVPGGRNSDLRSWLCSAKLLLLKISFSCFSFRARLSKKEKNSLFCPSFPNCTVQPSLSPQGEKHVSDAR